MMRAMTAFVSLGSTLIVHHSIPHYPLVVELVIKDDLITRKTAPYAVFLVSVPTWSQTQCWLAHHPAGTP